MSDDTEKRAIRAEVRVQELEGECEYWKARSLVASQGGEKRGKAYRLKEHSDDHECTECGGIFPYVKCGVLTFCPLCGATLVVKGPRPKKRP